MSALADQFGAKTPSTLKLPETIESDGLLVGWSLETRPRQRPIGFSFGADAGAPDLAARPILLEGEGHLITIAPTGAGKGIGCVVPALLRHKGPAIVIDPKGENAAITARRRRELGQQVIVLDPIGITSFPGDCLNPLDLIDPYSATAVDEAHVLIDQLLAFSNDRDKFWQGRARQLLVGALFHLLTDMPKSGHNLGRLRQIVNGAAESNGALLVEALEGSRHPEARNTARPPAAALGRVADDGDHAPARPASAFDAVPPRRSGTAWHVQRTSPGRHPASRLWPADLELLAGRIAARISVSE